MATVKNSISLDHIDVKSSAHDDDGQGTPITPHGEELGLGLTR